MPEDATIEILRKWSQFLLWLSIAFPILGALTIGARYYVDRAISRLSGTQTMAELERVREAASPPHLSLYTVKTEKRGDHIAALLQFMPSKNAPLGQLMFEACQLEPSSARIIRLWPNPEGGAFQSGNESESMEIAPDGRRAAVHYSPLGTGLPTLEIEITAPATITVRGSHLQKPLTVRIDLGAPALLETTTSEPRTGAP